MKQLQLVILICVLHIMGTYRVYGQTLRDTSLVKLYVEARKDSIFSIISKIDTLKSEMVGYESANNSRINFDIEYMGLNYIYILDIILLNDTNYITKFKKEIDIGYDDDIYGVKYQHYAHCILRKYNPRNPTKYMQLSLGDLREIKEFLLDWWKNNSQLPFEVLQDKWTKEKYLEKMGYRWF